MYTRQQSGPGAPATPNAPPNMSSSTANSKPGSDYSTYAGYGSYSADGYGAPPRSYGSDAGSGGYSSQPPNAGAKHFNDFKEWPSSWQPFVCAKNATPAHKNLHFYFNAVKTINAYYPAKHFEENEYTYYPDNKENENNLGSCYPDNKENANVGVALQHVNNLSNVGMCCNSWKRVGLINMKRAAGLVAPAKFNYSDWLDRHWISSLGYSTTTVVYRCKCPQKQDVYVHLDSFLITFFLFCSLLRW